MYIILVYCGKESKYSTCSVTPTAQHLPHLPRNLPSRNVTTTGQPNITYLPRNRPHTKHLKLPYRKHSPGAAAAAGWVAQRSVGAKPGACHPYHQPIQDGTHTPGQLVYGLEWTRWCWESSGGGEVVGRSTGKSDAIIGGCFLLLSIIIDNIKRIQSSNFQFNFEVIFNLQYYYNYFYLIVFNDFNII